MVDLPEALPAALPEAPLVCQQTRPGPLAGT